VFKGGSGLGRKLLISHLAIAAMGLALLIFSLGAIQWLRINTVRLAGQSAPTAQASLTLLNGIQQSLASLRGWVVLGREDFKKERTEAWERKIWPAMREIQKLDDGRPDAQGRAETKELRQRIKELEDLQWWIEDVAQTPGNLPARLLFEENIRPISRNIFDLITELVDQEKKHGGSLERKLLLGSIADFRGMAIYAEQYLRDFIENGKKEDEDEFKRYFAASKAELKSLLESQDAFDEKQKSLLSQVEWHLKDFELHAAGALDIRKNDEWNIAEHRLRTQAVPLEGRLTGLLTKFSEAHQARMRADAKTAVLVSRDVIRLSVSLILLMVLAAVLLSRIAAQRITKPILAIAASAQTLAGENQLGDVPILEQVGKGELTHAFQSMQLALERGHAELVRSNKDLEQFAYVASHDLQEPLQKITSFGRLLKEKEMLQADEESRLYVDRMDAAAKRMSQLIKDLLEYSRVNTKHEAFKPVDLNEVVSGVLSDLEIKIQESNAELEVQTLPNVEADPLQMRQIFQNFVGNALKYRKETDTPHILIACRRREDGKFYEISVKDNGIGFDPKESTRIFEPFQRLHGAGKYEGSGIGLSICQKIIRRYGGDVWVESEPGKGSTFYFTLPVTQKG
jgi:signal transduction histidine kinase